MVKSIPVNGTLAKEQSITFNTKDAGNWNHVIYGFQLTSYVPSFHFICSSISTRFMEKIGTVTLSCDANTVNMCGCILSFIYSPLESGIPSTRYFDWVDCKNKNTTVTFTNMDTDPIQFWGMIAEIDGPVLRLP